MGIFSCGVVLGTPWTTSLGLCARCHCECPSDTRFPSSMLAAGGPVGQVSYSLPFASGENSHLMAHCRWLRCDPWSRRGARRPPTLPRGPPAALRLCPAVSSASAGSPWGGVFGSEIRLTCMTSWCPHECHKWGMSLRQGFVLISSSQRYVAGPVCPDLREKLPAPGSTHMQVCVRPECEFLGKAYSGHCRSSPLASPQSIVGTTDQGAHCWHPPSPQWEPLIGELTAGIPLVYNGSH